MPSARRAPVVLRCDAHAQPGTCAAPRGLCCAQGRRARPAAGGAVSEAPPFPLPGVVAGSPLFGGRAAACAGRAMTQHYSPLLARPPSALATAVLPPASSTLASSRHSVVAWRGRTGARLARTRPQTFLRQSRDGASLSPSGPMSQGLQDLPAGDACRGPPTGWGPPASAAGFGAMLACRSEAPSQFPTQTIQGVAISFL